MAIAASASRWGATGACAFGHDEFAIELETIPCPSCFRTDFEAVLSSSDFLTQFKGEFALARCTSCNLVITNPRPTMDSIGYFYPDEYSPYDANELHKTNWWKDLLERAALRCYHGYPGQPVDLTTRLLALLALRRFASRKKRHDWIPFREGGKLLDVGCGGGVFLERMRKFGWDVCGLEMAEDVARRVERRTGIKVHVGTLPYAGFQPQSFDAVTFWHVMEHVPNPREVLESAAKLLRPKGLLVIEVPNIESWSFAEFGPYWYGLELPRHFQHFSPTTLTAMLPEGAFRNVEIQQIAAPSLTRLSAERAVAEGCLDAAKWLGKPKSYWAEHVNRTESNHQADLIRLVAERV